MLIRCPNHIRVLRSHVFRVKENPEEIWDPAKDGFTFSDEDDREGVHVETLRNWANGGKASLETIKRLCDFINTYLVVLSGPIEPSDFYGVGSLERLCTKIGYSEEDKYIQQYARIFATRGPQTDFLYPRAEAKAHARDYRGLYHVFRGQLIGTAARIIRLGLVVVGAVPVQREMYCIMGSLAIPSITGGRSYMYTGAICCKHQLTTWKFLEDHAATKRDYAIFMTGPPDMSRRDAQASGHMLTRKQGPGIASEAYELVVRKCADEIQHAEIAAYLHQAATVDPDNVDAELRDSLLAHNQKNIA